MINFRLSSNPTFQAGFLYHPLLRLAIAPSSIVILSTPSELFSVGRLQAKDMLAFNSSEFLYQGEDKGLGFSNSSFEDSANDIFNQYISHDSSEPSDSVNRTNDFHAFEFPLGDDITFGRKALDDKAFDTHNKPPLRRSHRFAPKGLRCTQSQDILPSQIYQKFARFETPKAAISGVELLNLEGKLAPQRVPVKTSFPPSSHTTVPPLRRKARFNANPPETLRYRHDKVSKSSGSNGGDSSKMMRPSYYYRDEMPSFQGWTRELEQIIIQGPQGDLPMARPSSDVLPRDDIRHCNVPTAGLSQQLSWQQVYDPQFGALQASNMPDIPERDALPLALMSDVDKGGQRSSGTTSTRKPERSHQDMESGTGILSVQSKPPSSFLQAATSMENFDYGIPPSQLQTSLLSASTCYYGNFEASQSAPVLPYTRNTDFSAHSLIDLDEHFDQFISKDPSNEFFIMPSDVMCSPKGDSIYPPIPSPTLPARPRTPSSPSSSACPSPMQTPATPKSPSKPRRRSKSSRRKSSAGTLKSPTSLDFVNFTPNDSQKILTGVAPSGSSKTKARREQEAIEKKRKLSLAAEKAVKDAGGDVEQLRAAKIFVE